MHLVGKDKLPAAKRHLQLLEVCPMLQFFFEFFCGLWLQDLVPNLARGYIILHYMIDFQL